MSHVTVTFSKIVVFNMSVKHKLCVNFSCCLCHVHNTQVLQALGVPLPSETKPAEENKSQSVATPAASGSDETTPSGSDDGAEVSIQRTSLNSFGI